MFLYNRNCQDVNDWVKQDMRSAATGIKEIKEDFKKFYEFDNFNVKHIDPIKYKNEIHFVVEHKFVPTNVNIGHSE